MDDSDIYGRSVTLRVSLRRAIHQAAAVTACSRFVLEDVGSTTVSSRARPRDPERSRANEAPSPRRWPAFERFVLGFGRAVHNRLDLLLSAFAEIAPPSRCRAVIGGSGQRGYLSRSGAAAVSASGRAAGALRADSRWHSMPVFSAIARRAFGCRHERSGGCPRSCRVMAAQAKRERRRRRARCRSLRYVALATAIDRCFRSSPPRSWAGRAGARCRIDWRVIAPQYRELYGASRTDANGSDQQRRTANREMGQRRDELAPRTRRPATVAPTTATTNAPRV